MKKSLKFAFGLAVILTVGCSLTLWTIFTVSELGLYLIGASYNEDLLAACLLNLPIICYVWWAWTREWSIEAIRKLINAK